VVSDAGAGVVDEVLGPLQLLKLESSLLVFEFLLPMDDVLVAGTVGPEQAGWGVP
jgi:hypothetical protein